MFRASTAHLQEDTFVHVQHMVLSLSMRVLTQAVYRQATTNCDSTICCTCTTVSSWRRALKARNMYRRILFYD